METSTCNSEDTLEELIRKTVDLLPEHYDDSQDFGIDQLALNSSRLKVFMGTCHCSLSTPGV